MKMMISSEQLKTLVNNRETVEDIKEFTSETAKEEYPHCIKKIINYRDEDYVYTYNLNNFSDAAIEIMDFHKTFIITIRNTQVYITDMYEGKHTTRWFVALIEDVVEGLSALITSLNYFG
jgi:hypothetical protein